MCVFLRVAVLLAVAWLAMPLATAQQVHVILVGDTGDNDSGADSRADLAAVRRFFAKVAEAGIPVAVKEVKGEAFSCGNILSSISSLRVSRNDTIFFYYSGHGGRQATTATKFPEFACQRTQRDAEMGLSGVVQLLERKAPRLAIAVADTCNKERRSVRVRAPFREDVLPASATMALRHLFLDYRGTIVLSAAIPGQEAWGDGYGSLFTRQLFYQSLPRVIGTGDGDVRPRWEAIIVDALRDIEVPTSPPQPQYPQMATRGLVEQWRPLGLAPPVRPSKN